MKLQQDPEFRKAFLDETPPERPADSLDDQRTCDDSQCAAFLPWKDEDLFFRRMIIVWDPIWNITSRAMMCRCILDEVAPGSHAPRIDIPVEFLCPRHAPRWWNAEDKAAAMPLRDYSSDPYFDKFGGYDMFRYYVLNTGGPFSAFHLDRDKLMPDHEFKHMQEQAHTVETEESFNAAREYEKELYKYSKSWVEKGRKAGFDPGRLEWARKWQQVIEARRPDINEPELSPETLRVQKVIKDMEGDGVGPNDVV